MRLSPTLNSGLVKDTDRKDRGSINLFLSFSGQLEICMNDTYDTWSKDYDRSGNFYISISSQQLLELAHGL